MEKRKPGGQFCTHEKFIEKMNKSKPHIEVLDTYCGKRNKIKFRCKIHGSIKYICPEKMMKSKYGCSECAKAGQSKIMQMSHEEFLKKVNDTVEVLSLYHGWYGKVKCRCKKCNYEWETGANSLAYNSACPKCKSSKGEQEIQKLLDDANIYYLYQYGFPDCKDKQKLLFDFYLPEQNVCIEYDGRQHFNIVGFGCKDTDKVLEKYKSTKRRDEIKNNYCSQKGIKLIRIPYYDKTIMENLINEIMGA